MFLCTLYELSGRKKKKPFPATFACYTKSVCQSTVLTSLTTLPDTPPPTNSSPTLAFLSHFNHEAEESCLRMRKWNMEAEGESFNSEHVFKHTVLRIIPFVISPKALIPPRFQQQHPLAGSKHGAVQSSVTFSRLVKLSISAPLRLPIKIKKTTTKRFDAGHDAGAYRALISLSVLQCGGWALQTVLGRLLLSLRTQ